MSEEPSRGLGGVSVEKQTATLCVWLTLYLPGAGSFWRPAPTARAANARNAGAPRQAQGERSITISKIAWMHIHERIKVTGDRDVPDPVDIQCYQPRTKSASSFERTRHIQRCVMCKARVYN